MLYILLCLIGFSFYCLFTYEYQNGDTEEGKSKRGQYEGPDADLAATLERDVLDAAPGVRFDDVAGLSEAKRLLEEAVVLPLLMPDYFQVHDNYIVCITYS